MAEKKPEKKIERQTAKKSPKKSAKTKELTPKQASRALIAARKEAAKAHAEAAQAKEAARLAAEAARKKAEKLAGGHVTGFVDFIRQQGVIGLAVGLAIGTAAGDTVRKMVEGFIAPVVQFIVGSREGLENATWTLEAFGRQADFKWGAFVSSLITLLATALVIYLIIHFLKLDKLDKKKA